MSKYSLRVTLSKLQPAGSLAKRGAWDELSYAKHRGTLSPMPNPGKYFLQITLLETGASSYLTRAQDRTPDTASSSVKRWAIARTTDSSQ